MSQKNTRNDCDGDGDSPLHFAAASGQLNLVRNHLRCGVNSANKLGWTPVMQAARNGQAACVKLLLKSGADITTRNNFGLYTLVLATASGSLETVSVVLRETLKSAKVQDLQKPISPVHISVLFGNTEILNYLINNSFSLNSASIIGGLTPVNLAKIVNNQEILNVLKRVPKPAKLKMQKSPNFHQTLPKISIYHDLSPKTPTDNLLGSMFDLTQLNSTMRRHSNLLIELCSPNMSPISVNSPKCSFSSQTAHCLMANGSSNREDRLNERMYSWNEVNCTFLVSSPAEGAKNLHLDSTAKILNWLSELKQRIPKTKSLSNDFKFNEQHEEDDDVFYTIPPKNSSFNY